MKISVIIPVYNIEQYIQECISSILNQTHKNLEIIIINDGSTDGSKDICTQASTKDARIKLINQENRGVSAARNAGLEIATGDYITFVDGDDSAPPEYIEHLLSMTRDSTIDIVTSKTKSGDIGLSTEPSTLSTISGKEAAIRLMHQRILNGPMGKLIKRDLLNTIRFQEDLKVGEDLVLNYQILRKANLVATSNARLYTYRERQGSASRSKNTESRHKLILTLEEIRSRVEGDRELYTAVTCRIFAESMSTLSTLLSHQSKYKDTPTYRHLINIVRRERLRTLLNPSTLTLPRLRAYALSSYIHPHIPHLYVSLKRRLKIR